MQTSELKIGQKVTVLSWVFPDGDNSYKGDVLEIKAIDLPFIVVENMSDGWGQTLKFDTRQVNFKELSGDYVKAALN
jgi:hypothetical protein